MSANGGPVHSRNLGSVSSATQQFRIDVTAEANSSEVIVLVFESSGSGDERLVTQSAFHAARARELGQMLIAAADLLE